MATLSAICKYRVAVPLASLLPDRLLGWIIPRWKWCLDPDDGWTFWLDASYWKWARCDKRKIVWQVLMSEIMDDPDRCKEPDHAF